MGDTYPAASALLAEASELVGNDRRADYAHPTDDFARIGRMWGAVLGIPDVPPETVGLCMAALKIARESWRHKHDNLADLAGYAATVAVIHDAK